MTGPGPDGESAAVASGGAVDVVAVLAAIQDQLDDLTAAVAAQQRTIDELVRAQRGSGPGRHPATPGTGP